MEIAAVKVSNAGSLPGRKGNDRVGETESDPDNGMEPVVNARKGIDPGTPVVPYTVNISFVAICQVGFIADQYIGRDTDLPLEFFLMDIMDGKRKFDIMETGLMKILPPYLISSCQKNPSLNSLFTNTPPFRLRLL
jgi:hypothetical protein